jgi:hypothetical protein
MGYEIRGDGPAKMRELAAKLKTADPILKRELRRALKDAASGASDAARASILAMPGEKTGTPPLRPAVANSVTIRTRFGNTINVAIVAEPTKMPAGMGNMPYRLNRETFNHPVYGQRKVWVTQRGKPNWFDGAVHRAGTEAQNNISDAMQTTADYITGTL